MLKWIYDRSPDQLKDELAGLGQKPFVADQVCQWLYQKNIQDISAWSNVSKQNREILAQNYDTSLDLVKTLQNDHKGTKKLLLELRDKNRIEAVIMPEKGHFTLCISTQVGCALGCSFCATGTLGFKRNLSPGEILSQVLLLKKEIGDYEGKLNLVFMGMGEPLLNYEALKQALFILTAEKGLSISPRNITVSTAGVLKGIKRLEKDFPRVKISLSLNAPDEKLREKLMPINRREPLGSILGYFRETRRKQRITFEYVLLKGINDSLEDAEKLARTLRGIPCKINLIPYNETRDSEYSTPGDSQVDDFSEYLHRSGFTVLVRRSKGRDIKSACGQ